MVNWLFGTHFVLSGNLESFHIFGTEFPKNFGVYWIISKKIVSLYVILTINLREKLVFEVLHSLVWTSRIDD